MSIRTEFFSPKHKQLLSIAVWAKILAWVVLVIFTIRAGLVIVENLSYYHWEGMGVYETVRDFWDTISLNPAYFLIDTGADMVGYIFRGIFSYVVLKGISLGLNMIVETDINYREKKNEEGA